MLYVLFAILGGGEEQNREEGEMAQKIWEEGEIGGKSRDEGEKETSPFREEGEIGSQSRKKGDLPPCSPPPLLGS